MKNKTRNKKIIISNHKANYKLNRGNTHERT